MFIFYANATNANLKMKLKALNSESKVSTKYEI